MEINTHTHTTSAATEQSGPNEAKRCKWACGAGELGQLGKTAISFSSQRGAGNMRPLGGEAALPLYAKGLLLGRRVAP